MQKLTFFLFLLLLISTLQLNAQTTPPSSVFTGRLFTTEGFEIEFKRFQMDSTAYQYQTVSEGLIKYIEADEILRIEKVVGTETGKWVLGMGGSGLFGSMLGTELGRQRLERQGMKVDTRKTRNYIIGWTVGSALLGAIIGSTKKKYKTIYENPKYKNNTQSFHFDLIPNDKGGSLALRYRF
ncbi:MAG: hypothetical protein ACPG49_08205 [Chitinophagales bacterium]